IRSRVEFAAGVEEVFAMMTDRSYLEEVCQASHPRSYEVEVTGTTTVTKRKLPAPGAAAKFTGPEVTVLEETAWGPADANGNRTGRVTMSVPGQPVTMKGAVQLSAGGAGTVAELTGDLKVTIPILGKKLEQASAPAILAGFNTQQKVGDAWLSE
ncbi:MAG: DUF2505 domain-containing protein, partial [Microlunatus sp.]|nr:DUF2505 domain-containing protein [Microlunatus sp.]